MIIFKTVTLNSFERCHKWHMHLSIMTKKKPTKTIILVVNLYPYESIDYQLV